MELYVGGKYQGKLKCALVSNDAEKIWNNFQDFIKKCCEERKSQSEIEQLVNERICTKKIEAVVCDELGCGVVPVSETERNWREVTGRLLCMLAENCEKVFRVTCGIAQRIK